MTDLGEAKKDEKDARKALAKAKAKCSTCNDPEVGSYDREDHHDDECARAAIDLVNARERLEFAVLRNFGR